MRAASGSTLTAIESESCWRRSDPPAELTIAIARRRWGYLPAARPGEELRDEPTTGGWSGGREGGATRADKGTLSCRFDESCE